MIFRNWMAACLCVITAIALTGCGNKDGNKNSQSGTGTSSTPVSVNNNGDSGDDAAATGVEKVKPAPGTGNVQGKVLYNGKPVPNIEVKLCEKFSQYMGGCSGKTYTAKTDAEGDYVVTNAEPKVYEGLTVRVFDTDMYVFATTGVAGISASKYEVAADKTLFVRPTQLFKSDLKTLNPKAGAKVSGQNLELKWEPYPDAAYYKISLYPEEMSVTSPYIGQRVEGSSFVLDKPLPKGEYRWKIEAFNGSDQKLSEGPDDFKFTITDGAS
jgi:hypothetical protein